MIFLDLFIDQYNYRSGKRIKQINCKHFCLEVTVNSLFAKFILEKILYDRRGPVERRGFKYKNSNTGPLVAADKTKNK